MGKTKLTVQQLRALAIVEEFTGRGGAGPTLRELADGLDLAAESAARRHITELAQQGLVTVERKGEQMRAAARTLRVTDRGRRLVARWEQFHSSGQLRGERELFLDQDEWTAAQQTGLFLRTYWVRSEGAATVLTFRTAADRNAWVLAFLGETEKPRSGTA